MSINSLVLYGSCARGDSTKTSDVDVLAIVKGKTYNLRAVNKLNIVTYGKELFIEKLQGGNLFSLHIVKESIIIYDTISIKKNVFTKFAYKQDYQTEIKDASDLAYVLLKFQKNFDNYFFYNKRIAWCVRTILIAKSAEERNPIFSSKDLSDRFNSNEAFFLINNKNSHHYSSKTHYYLSVFLSKYGKEEPKWLNDISTISDCKSFFETDSYPFKVLEKIKIDY